MVKCKGKVSKHKELGRAKKLEEVKKNDPEKGEAIAKKEARKAAEKRSEMGREGSNKGSVKGRETTKKVCKYS